MDTIGVVVGTFGDRSQWDSLAERALASVERQSVTADAVIRSHRDTLHEARNVGASTLGTDWLIFLDADDELDAGYIEAMRAGVGDIRQPATLGVVDGVEDDFPVVIPKKRLIDGNYIVIGAMVRSSLFFKVGGFDDYPMSEDWALWLKCWIAGAEIRVCPDAIYRVHVRSGSRNTDPGLGNRVYNQIRSRYYEEAHERLRNDGYAQ